MSNFKIELRDGDEYITHLEQNFTLKVIPPEKQPEGYELGRQVVGADLTVFADYLLFGTDRICYDFESLDNGYYDDDSQNCNKQLWFETIAYYCKLVLDAEPEHYTPYNYDYDLTEENCSPECWAALTGNHKEGEILEVGKRSIEIIPAFDSMEQAMEEGVLSYQLFDSTLDDPQGPDFGRLLFDLEDNWIYEGKALAVSEQKQVAEFILKD